MAVADIECVAGFSVEVYRGLCEHLNIHDKEPKVLRRNVLTSGINLNSLVGEDFDLQGIRFAGVAECSPCCWMDVAFGPGAEDYHPRRGSRTSLAHRRRMGHHAVRNSADYGC